MDDAGVPAELTDETPVQVGTGGEELGGEGVDQGRPSKIWRSYHELGLIRHPYRGKQHRPKLSELPPRVKYRGTTDDLLRSLGRLNDR